MTDLDARLRVHRLQREQHNGQARKLASDLRSLVREAQRAGYGVQASADALGVSRQSVHEILKEGK